MLHLPLSPPLALGWRYFHRYLDVNKCLILFKPVYLFFPYAICCPCHSIKVLKFSDETLSKVRRFLICKISTLSVSDFMKPVKSNPSQAAEQ